VTSFEALQENAIRLPSGEKAGYCLDPPKVVKGMNVRFASAGTSRREIQA